MIGSILARVGLSAVTRGGWGAIAIIAAVAASGGFYSGFKVADWRCSSAEARALKQAEAERDEAQRRADLAAKRYLDLRQNPPVKYKEIIREVPKLVDSGKCRVTDYGMRKLDCALHPSKCPPKP